SEGRTPADNATVRTVFIIGPDKKIKPMLIYPMSTGRNFAEVLRILDSLQLTAKMGVSTPVNWQPGGDVVVPAAMPEEEVKRKFPNGIKTLKPYLRMGSLPKSYVGKELVAPPFSRTLRKGGNLQTRISSFLWHDFY